MSHYETLGIAKNASPDEIKKAYRKLASTHHPDKGGDTATFQKIQSAYEILSDPVKRAEYDNPKPQGMNGFPGGFQFHGNDFDLSEIFGQMFGMNNMRQGPTSRQQTQVFRTQLNVTLEDAYNGATNTIQLQTPTGIKAVTVNIPKGLQDGSQMRYENILDNAVLIIIFKLIPHLKYDRRGNDLYCNHSISVLDLIVGTKFEFTGISGKTLEVTVQPKTQPYMQLKIAGAGMPIQNTTIYGDQIILLKPHIPDTIDPEIVQTILKHQKT